MKHFILFFIGSLFFLFSFSQAPLTLKDSALANAGYSVYAMDAATGKEIFCTPQISLVPASVMKIVTTSTALEVLGANFEFHTQLGYKGKINAETGILEGDLILKGGGDPAFYSGYFPEHYKGTFETWGTALAKAGIKTIHGNLIVDVSCLEGWSIPGGWPWDDIGNYYGAGVSGLTYSDNYYKILFSSAAESGQRVKISSILPSIDSLVLTNKVVSSSVNRDEAYIYGAPGSFNQIVEGSIPKGRTDFVVKASMPDPAKIAASEFIKVLRNNKIGFVGKVLINNLLPITDFIQVADKVSPPLDDLIVPLNKESVNLFAEHLLREIGRARKGSSSIDSSIVAVNDFWKEKKVYLKGFYPTDGSGLSRSNAFCTRTLAEMLRYMYLSTNSEVFFNSLPVAAKDGTLQFAFKGTKLENNLRAKTGSMTRVRSLAGIFTNQAGRKVIFAVMANNFEGNQSVVGKVMENLLNELYLLDVVARVKGKQ